MGPAGLTDPTPEAPRAEWTDHYAGAFLARWGNSR